MKEIYLISGLGADKRVFANLNLPEFKLNHIYWIEPKSAESISAYARRLAEQIKTQNPIIIGVSFGGILAQEIARIFSCEKVIIISSVKSKTEIPILYRIFGILRLYKLVPSFVFKQSNFLVYYFFGVKSKEDKILLRQILNDTDTKFLKWAIEKILFWDRFYPDTKIVSLHGSNDKLLPMDSPNYVIDEGGHLMVLTKAKEVSQIVNEILNSR